MSEQTTLRDTLENAIDEDEEQVAAPARKAAPEPAPQETQAQADQRARDEKGRFAAAEAAERAAKPAAAPKADPLAPAPLEAAPAPQRPSSWRKEMWQHFDAMPPDVQKYILQREGEFSRGVSTYKAEAERSKEIIEAIAPYQDSLQKVGLSPAEATKRLFAAHQALLESPPLQKVQLLQQIARDYGVPLEYLAQQQGQPGGYGQPGYGQPATDPMTQWAIAQIQELRQEQQQARSRQEQEAKQQAALEVTTFGADKEHFDEVRETMARLLEAGLADTLEGAYDKALRYHDDIWQQKLAQEAARKAEENRKVVQRARSAAVSTRGSSPTGTMTTGEARKGLRDTIAEQLDSVGGGRV